jgi:hypothetical protein
MRKYSHSLRVNGVFLLTEGVYKVPMSKLVFMAMLLNKESGLEAPSTTSYSFHGNLCLISSCSAALGLTLPDSVSVLFLLPGLSFWFQELYGYGCLHQAFKGCPQSIRDGQRNKEEETQNRAHTEVMNN